MKEADFNTELVNSLEFFGFYAYKIADMPNAARRVIKFIPVKPCDIIGCSPKGRFLGIESKLNKKWQGINKGTLRDSQINNLDKMIKNNGRAFVIVNFRIEAVKSKGIKRENVAVVFDWKYHREELINGAYVAKDMREKSKGFWITSKLSAELSDTKTKKRLWDLKELFSHNGKNYK